MLNRKGRKYESLILHFTSRWWSPVPYHSRGCGSCTLEIAWGSIQSSPGSAFQRPGQGKSSLGLHYDARSSRDRFKCITKADEFHAIFASGDITSPLWGSPGSPMARVSDSEIPTVWCLTAWDWSLAGDNPRREESQKEICQWDEGEGVCRYLAAAILGETFLSSRPSS